MRPALHRLLSRPFSLELLRYLTTTYLESTSTITRQQRPSKGRIYHQSRHVSQAAAFCNSADEDSSTFPCMNPTVPHTTFRGYPVKDPSDGAQKKSSVNKRNSIDEWTFDEFEFESALDQPNNTGRQRLVEKYKYRSDLQLWAQLLTHRRRIHGIRGTKVIWDRMRYENLRIPTGGPLSEVFWSTFIDLGMKDKEVLLKIMTYPNLPMLYARILQHWTLKGHMKEVEKWHERLISKHPPPADRFKAMVETILKAKGDMAILRYIYEGNKYRKFYSQVVPVLCEQNRYEEALKWHYVLISHRDLPLDDKFVKPLQRYLEFYFPKLAVEFNQSLQGSGVKFVNGYSPKFELTREMMNRVHGVHYGIKEAHYNDKLGARWFTTTWVSLDTAINTVQSLGFREIGPLSLQAIALREPVASNIIARIKQLENLGISIGRSKFSQAVKLFAKRQSHTLLQSLLESDQHPDSLEDWRLQESLLIRYADIGDWTQYARTREICRLGGSRTKTLEFNNLLRDQLSQPEFNLESISKVLDEMRGRGLPVQPTVSRSLVQLLLRRRQKAHRPVHISWNHKDLDIVISMLRNLLKSGSWIPESVWHEIITRLGMMGRFTHLEMLCLFLADWYHPKSTYRQQNIFAQSRGSPDLRRFETASEIPSSHPKHPFSLLFSTAFQRAVVEWGFIKYFHQFVNPSSTKVSLDESSLQPTTIRSQTDHISYSAASKLSDFTVTGNHPITQGIHLLHRLRGRGVSIQRSAVRSAVINRLVVMYAPGHSNKMSNRIARKVNPFTFYNLVNEVEAGWMACKSGNRKKLFDESDGLVDLKRRIHALGVSRSARVRRRRARDVEKLEASRGGRSDGRDQIY